jgi:hypothetical protein
MIIVIEVMTTRTTNASARDCWLSFSISTDPNRGLVRPMSAFWNTREL